MRKLGLYVDPILVTKWLVNFCVRSSPEEATRGTFDIAEETRRCGYSYKTCRSVCALSELGMLKRFVSGSGGADPMTSAGFHGVLELSPITIDPGVSKGGSSRTLKNYCLKNTPYSVRSSVSQHLQHVSKYRVGHSVPDRPRYKPKSAMESPFASKQGDWTLERSGRF